MPRRTRAIFASTLVVGVSVFAAPQWASGESSTGSDAPVAESAAPRPSLAAPAATIATPTNATPTTITSPVPDETVIPTEPAPTTTAVPTTTTEPAPTTTEGAALAVAAPVDPAPSPEPEQSAPASTGTIRVTVEPTEGASRSVTLQQSDGRVIAAQVPVTGDPIVFDGLAAGSYDLFVEQDYDDGATFLTRTPVVVDGDDIAVTCDAETLDCTIA